MNRLISKGMSNIYLNSSYFKFTPVFFQLMFLRSTKEVDKLIGKVMLNIYLNK